MNGREIPGYYFDAEKNKYFKIQAHHQVPTGSKYSRSTVKDVRAAEERVRKATDDAVVRKQTLVQRSKISQHAAATGVGLSREIAEGTSMRWRGLENARAWTYGNGMQLNWERNWEKLVGRDVISTFAYDGITSDIMVGE